MSGIVPRFISEKELAERRQRDEAEGKKEEPYDHRPLYDRLQAERVRKQEEFEAAASFRNQVHRLDPEEAEFLAKVEQQKFIAEECAEEEAARLIHEAKVTNRNSLVKVATERSSTAKNQPVRQKQQLVPTTSLDQKRLMSGIKRKTVLTTDPQEAKRSHLEVENTISTEKTSTHANDSSLILPDFREARTIVARLPGLDAYSENSSSDSSSNESTDIEDSVQTLGAIAVTRMPSSNPSGCGE